MIDSTWCVWDDRKTIGGTDECHLVWSNDLYPDIHVSYLSIVKALYSYVFGEQIRSYENHERALQVFKMATEKERT